MRNGQRKYDVIVVGAGLVGLSTAYQIKQKDPNKKILILEKADKVAAHQSGHNSGVIHSGIYYKPGSLKAKNCIRGYDMLTAFANRYGVPFERCGKLIVATTDRELPMLKAIYDRGIANGLSGLELLSSDEFQEIEPRVSGVQAITVPQTGIVDYPALARKLLDLLQVEHDVEVCFNEEVDAINTSGAEHVIGTTKGQYRSTMLVSCTGLHADRVARLTGDMEDLRIIPFRGEYYKLKPEKEYLVNHLVYPVPNPNFPFLGVHFTRMIGGGIEAGPNAVLAFKREGYKFSSFNIRDSIDTFTWPGFWKVVGKYGKTGMGEIYRSLSKSAFTRALQELVPGIQENDLIPGGAGVRAQACDKHGRLIDDFDIVSQPNIVHVRNAPSPAATSCLSIGYEIANRLIS